MNRSKLFLYCSSYILLFTASFACCSAASGSGSQTLFTGTLSGRDMTYQAYLPAALQDGVTFPETDTVSTSRNFNQPADIAPFDTPVRIYWELSVSAGAGEKTLAMPQLIVAPASEAATASAWVNESFSGDTRFGSFILPAHTGMAVRLNTGAWEKRTALFSTHREAYLCKLKIDYRPADRDLPPALQHIDGNIFNRYINTLIKDRAAEIKTALINENLYDLTFRKVDFKIQTGVLLIDFTAYYKGRTVLGIPFQTQADGTAEFEVRFSGDGARLGLYCRGLVGSFDIPNDLGLLDNWGRSYINKKITAKQYWTGLHRGTGDAAGEHPATETASAEDASDSIPTTYLVFKNDNLADIINQALLAGQMHSFDTAFLGGLVKMAFREVTFLEFNLMEGHAQGSCRLDAEISLLGQDTYRIENAGTVDSITLDFYIDSTDQSWWARISGFHLTLSGVSPLWNGIVNEMIAKKLADRHGLMPLQIPAGLTGPTQL